MTLGELREMTKGLPDDARVYVNDEHPAEVEVTVSAKKVLVMLWDSDHCEGT